MLSGIRLPHTNTHTHIHIHIHTHSFIRSNSLKYSLVNIDTYTLFHTNRRTHSHSCTRGCAPYLHFILPHLYQHCNIFTLLSDISSFLYLPSTLSSEIAVLEPSRSLTPVLFRPYVLKSFHNSLPPTPAPSNRQSYSEVIIMISYFNSTLSVLSLNFSYFLPIILNVPESFAALYLIPLLFLHLDFS